MGKMVCYFQTLYGLWQMIKLCEHERTHYFD